VTPGSPIYGDLKISSFSRVDSDRRREVSREPIFRTLKSATFGHPEVSIYDPKKVLLFDTSKVSIFDPLKSTTF